jgi:hypothetical protein
MDRYLRSWALFVRWLVEVAPSERAFLEGFFLDIYTARAHNDGTVDEIIEEVLAFPYKQRTEDVQRFLDAFIHHDTTERLAEITAPTLVLAGGRDSTTRPELCRAVADRGSRARGSRCCRRRRISPSRKHRTSGTRASTPSGARSRPAPDARRGSLRLEGRRLLTPGRCAPDLLAVHLLVRRPKAGPGCHRRGGPMRGVNVGEDLVGALRAEPPDEGSSSFGREAPALPLDPDHPGDMRDAPGVTARERGLHRADCPPVCSAADDPVEPRLARVRGAGDELCVALAELARRRGPAADELVEPLVVEHDGHLVGVLDP